MNVSRRNFLLSATAAVVVAPAIPINEELIVTDYAQRLIGIDFGRGDFTSVCELVRSDTGQWHIVSQQRFDGLMRAMTPVACA